MTPYLYCNQSPVMLIDLTGMEGEENGITPPPKLVGKGVEIGSHLIYNDVLYTVTNIEKGGFLKRDKVEWTYSITECKIEYVGGNMPNNEDAPAFDDVCTPVKHKAYSKIKRWSGKELDIPTGSHSQEFFYIYSKSGAARSSMGGDTGYFKSGDKILPINWDDFVKPGAGGFDQKTTTKNLAMHLFNKYLKFSTSVPGKVNGVYNLIEQEIRQDTIVPTYNIYNNENINIKVDKDSFEQHMNNHTLGPINSINTYSGKKDTVK